MFAWLKKKPQETPLAGAPPVRRQKTYSAESGYVYQYYYLGYRAAERSGAPGVEYVFDVSADRKLWFPVTVFVAASALDSWQKRQERPLIDSERYAVAKLSLLQAFDQRSDPAAMTAEVRPGAEDVDSILETLGIV